MAEEQATAEPEAQTTLKDFGDLDAAFDKVFPSTAEKKEEAPPPPAPEPKAEPEAKAPAAEAPKPAAPAADDLPDFVTGKKPEEPKPAEPELPPPGPKESVGMKQLRTAYENLKRKSQEQERTYSTQIEELKKTPPAPPDAEATIQQLQKQNEELTAAVERTAIEYSPKFRAEFVDKRVQLVKDAHDILNEVKVDPALWDRAMSLSGSARTDALEEIYDSLPRAVSSELGSAAREIRSLDSRKEAFLSDRKGRMEQLQQENLTQQREAMKAQEKHTLDIMGEAEKDLVERMGIEVYKMSDKPEHKKWNESVEKMRADARKILLETDDESVLARAAYLAPAAIQYRYLYHIMKDRWLEEKAKNEAIEKAEPTAETRGETAPAGNDKLSFADAVAKSVFSK